MKIINLVISIFFIFIKVKKVWSKPKKAKVLIYDNAFSELFEKYINKKEIEVYHNRIDENSSINLYVILKCLIKLDFKLKKYKSIYFNYVNPKIVITINDNNLGFYQLKKIFPNIIFIAIQMSWKYDTEFDIIHKRHLYKNNSQLYCDYLFCYNKYIAKKYLSFIKVKKIFYIGSFKSNSYNLKKKINDSIIYISQWRNYNQSLSYHKKLTFGDWQKNEILFLKKLSEYLLRKSIKLTILGKTTNSAIQEKKFYDEIFKKNYTFITQSYLRNHYDILDKCKLTLTLDSTLGYENLSRGNRTIFFSIRNSYKKNFDMIRFCWPLKKKRMGPNWTNKITFKEFERLFLIKDMSDRSWKKIINNHFKRICIYDINNSKFLRLIKTFQVPLNLN